MADKPDLWIDYPPEFEQNFRLSPAEDFQQQCNNALRRVTHDPSLILKSSRSGKDKGLYIYTGDLKNLDGTLKDKQATMKVDSAKLALKVQRLAEMCGVTPLDILVNAKYIYNAVGSKVFSQKPLSDKFVYATREELSDPRTYDARLGEYHAYCKQLDAPPKKNTPPEEAPDLIRPEGVQPATVSDMNKLVKDRLEARDPAALAADRISKDRASDKTWGQIENIKKGGKGARPRDMD